jgi:hypothetical protein
VAVVKKGGATADFCDLGSNKNRPKRVEGRRGKEKGFIF